MTMSSDSLEDRSINKSLVNLPTLIPPAESDTGPLLSPEDPTPQPPKYNLKKILLLSGLGLGSIMAIVLGYRYWQYNSIHESTDNAIVVGHIHDVSSKIAGTVTEVMVNDNEEVQPGQLLVKLDRRDYENKVQQTQAALESARRQANAAQASIALAAQTSTGKTTQAEGDIGIAQAAISTAQANVTEAQAGIPLAQAQVAQADANLEKARTDYDRYSTLYEQGAISQQQRDTAKAAFQVAQAQKTSALQGVQQANARLAQAQESIVSAQAKLSASQGGIEQATATEQQTVVNRSQYEAAKGAIVQAAAALKEAQLQLSYINITAPIAGRIGKKNVEIGNRVQVGVPLMAIIGNEYWVVANLKETQFSKIKLGQPAEVKLDAFPGKTFTGRIDSLSPASGAQFALLPPDNATGNFTKIVQRIPVKVVLDSQSINGYGDRITPGMSAEVTIETK